MFVAKNREKSDKLLNSILIPVFTILIMALVKLVEIGAHQSFSALGVIPRETEGAIGIITAPLIHGNLSHLGNNTLSLFLFGWALFYFYELIAVRVWLVLYLGSGLMVWLFARGGVAHIGASGVIYGLAFFLFISGVLRKNRRLAVLSLLLSLFYGGMVWGVLPTNPKISWEAHLSGAIIGAIAAVYYRKKTAGIEVFDRREAVSETSEQHDLIGDEWKEPNYSAQAQSAQTIDFMPNAPNINYVYIPKEDVKSSGEKSLD